MDKRRIAYNADDGIVLAVSRIANSDGHNGGPPVTKEAFSASLEDGF